MDKCKSIKGFVFFRGSKYTCTFANCGLQFKRKDQLNAHEYTHTNIKKFQCIEAGCTKSYSNNAHLQRHKRTAHHQYPSHQLHYCNECSSYYESWEKFDNHQSKVHSKKSREYQCDHCDMKFNRKTKLKLHIYTHTGNYKYKCEKCDKGFFQLGHFKRHEKIHEERKCNECDEVFTKWSLLQLHKKKDHTNSVNKCDVCNKIFGSKRGLKYHSQIHVDLNDRIIYTCTYESCPKFFFQRRSMLAHYKSKHENRTFVCPIEGCGRELSTKQKLEMHVKVIHEGKKEEKPKIVKARAKRKDKGKQKISTASKLFNILLPGDVEQAIIDGNGDKVLFRYENKDIDDDEENCLASPQLQINEKQANEIECCN